MKASDLVAGGGFAGATVVPVVHKIPDVQQSPFYSEVWAFGWTGSDWSFGLLFVVGCVGLVAKILEIRNSIIQKKIYNHELRKLEQQELPE